MQQREVVVAQLIGVIQAIQQRRMSGKLVVRRGEGGTFEEGTILFEGGRATQARVGRRSGSDAVNWLSTWGACRYIFTSPDLFEASTAMFSLQLAPSPPVSEKAQQNTEPNTNAISRTGPLRDNTPIPPSFYAVQSIPYSPGAIPQRTQSLDSALSVITEARFSRIYRHLLLLLDGQRTMNELAQLLNRNEQEVLGLLHDLEGVGLISFRAPH